MEKNLYLCTFIMEHLFIINPNAGNTNSTKEITDKLKTIPTSVKGEMHLTIDPGEGTRFVSGWCKDHPDQPVRFYSCGGDGTLNEVVSGLVGYKNAEVACYPSGSGSDYVRYFEKEYGVTREDFLDVKKLVLGKAVPVDLMRVTCLDGEKPEVRYCINVGNIGLEADVARTMQHVKRWPLLGGARSYTTAVFKSLFTSRYNHCQFKVDGEEMWSKPFLLCTFANASHEGGGYCCAPQAKVDDGLIEASLFRTVSLLTFARLIGHYRRGTYTETRLGKKVRVYRQGKTVELKNDKPFYIGLDGEILHGSHFLIEQLPQAVNFVIPKK